jgi:N-acetyl-anhydromuramyl-L-alanine amidase AmpD
MDDQQSIVIVLGAALLLVGSSVASAGIKYQPVIIDKYKTGELKRHPTLEYNTRPLSGVTHIIVHHSASRTHMAEDFARWHVDQRGWPGIGYHFVIEKDGTIIQGNPIDLRSYHASPYNTRSIGICLSGNFDQEQPTTAQLQALDWLVADLRRRLKQFNNGHTLEVLGHRNVSSTSCPGDALYNYIQKYKFN